MGMVRVRWVQQVATADPIWGCRLTHKEWWFVTVDRSLGSTSLSGSLPTELGLLTGLTSMCAHHAMG